jgi:ParB/RepB/Spo0J family partition protein
MPASATTPALVSFLTEEPMNAPTPAMLFTPTVEALPIASIRPSHTHIQQLRRQHFDAEKLLELAASIRANGLLQPILVRPLHRPDGTHKYEIVAGERRWLAADRAGFAHIPANISDLSDTQVLEAQLIENLQREDLRALEEAEGYRELMDLKHINADELAALIGKSRSYVYARTKLLDLCAPARAALADGTIDASKALFIARIKGDKLQQKALHMMQREGAHYSYRRLVESLRADFMIPIALAPFAIDDDAIAAPKGEPICACIDCPHYSANDPELQREIGDAHVCTDRACFDLKTKLFWNARRRAAEAAGRTVLTGEAAKAVVPARYEGVVKNGHLWLDAETDINFPEPEPEQGKDESEAAYDARLTAWNAREDAWNPPTYRQLLGDELPAETVLAETGKGTLVELVPVKAVAKQLKARGVEIPKWMLKEHRDEPAAREERQDPAQAAAERAKEEERQKVETEWRARLLRQIHAKWKPPLKTHDLRHITEAMLDGQNNSDAFDALYPGRPDLDKLKDADLQRFMVIYAINHECEFDAWSQHKPTALLDYAQRLKIDAKKLRAEVVRDLKPVSAPPEPPAAKKATKKGRGK